MAGGGTQGTLITVLAGAAAGGTVVATGGAGALALPGLVAAGGAAVGAGAAAYGGYAQYQASQAESAQLKLAADREKLAARQRAVAIREEMNRNLATQTAAFAGRGIGPGGAPATIAAKTRLDAGIDLNLNTYNAGSTRREFGLRRSQARASGQAGLISGIGQGATVVGGAI